MIVLMLKWCWMLLLLCGGLGCRSVAYQVQYVADGDTVRGRQLISDYGCGTCHHIPTIPNANAWVGPPLTKWAQRSYIAGTLPNTPENLVIWLQDPQALHNNSAMPNLGISAQEARDISAYLYTLR